MASLTSQRSERTRNGGRERNEKALPPIRTFLGTELSLPLPRPTLRRPVDVNTVPVPGILRDPVMPRNTHAPAQFPRPDSRSASVPSSASLRSPPPSSERRKLSQSLPPDPPFSCTYVLRPSRSGGLITSASTWRPRLNPVNQPESPRPTTSESTNASPKCQSEVTRKHVCPVCQKRFNRPSSLKTHENVHTGSRPFTCPFPGCTKVFSVASNMRRHHLRTHGSEGHPGSDGELDADDAEQEGYYEWIAAYEGP